MTLESDLTAYLTRHGLWPAEAEFVMDAVKALDKTRGFQWSASSNVCPPAVFAMLVMTAKPEALKYIDDHMPAHFARPRFEETK